MAAPVNTVAPVLTRVGAQLSCTQGTWTNSPTSFQYRWQRQLTPGVWDPLEGTVGNTLTVGSGGTYRCLVTAFNAG